MKFKKKLVKDGNSSGNLLFLDGLRGVAALVVMLGHARWMFWEGFSSGYLLHPELYSPLAKILVYFLSVFRFGHQAVLFFFVLSGFVIHLKYSKSLSRDANSRFDSKDYFIRRFRRIYPPYVFAIGATFLLDYIGQRAGYSIYSQQTPNQLLNDNISMNHSFLNLVGNLLFWRGETVGSWGTNGPLWSLKYEWWFYCIYPLLFLINRKYIKISTIVVILLFIIPFVVQIEYPYFIISVFQYLFSWWCGVIVADIYTGRISFKYSVVSLTILFIPFMVKYETRIVNPLIADTIWAIGFSGLICFLFFLRGLNIKLVILEKLHWLGECSYSLYILHFPIFVLLNGVLLRFTDNKMPVTQIYILLFSILMVGIAYGIHFIIEKPFIRKSKVIQNSLKLKNT